MVHDAKFTVHLVLKDAATYQWKSQWLERFVHQPRVMELHMSLRVPQTQYSPSEIAPVAQ